MRLQHFLRTKQKFSNVEGCRQCGQFEKYGIPFVNLENDGFPPWSIQSIVSRAVHTSLFPPRVPLPARRSHRRASGATGTCLLAAATSVIRASSPSVYALSNTVSSPASNLSRAVLSSTGRTSHADMSLMRGKKIARGGGECGPGHRETAPRMQSRPARYGRIGGCGNEGAEQCVRVCTSRERSMPVST